MSRLIILLALVSAAASSYADVKKEFNCGIGEKKFVVELTYPDSDPEVPNNMRVSQIIYGQPVLRMAGPPVVAVDPYIDGDNVKQGAASFDISLSSPTARSSGYTLFLNVYGKGHNGFATNEKFGAKPEGNCPLK